MVPLDEIARPVGLQCPFVSLPLQFYRYHIIESGGPVVIYMHQAVVVQPPRRVFVDVAAGLRLLCAAGPGNAGKI